MINADVIIGAILKPLIENGTIGLYHYGNKHEFKEVCASEKYQTQYPVVWLEMPFSGSPKEMILQKSLDCRIKLILGTSTQKEWLNPQRNIETYEKVLNPLYDAIVSTFQSSQYIIIKRNEINTNKFPNFWGEEQGTRLNPPKRLINDYWDVITMEFEAIISYPYCLFKPERPIETRRILLINGRGLLIDSRGLLISA